MLKRMRDLVRFLKGDFIVLRVERDTLIVDARNFKKEQLQEVASTFFKKVYSL